MDISWLLCGRLLCFKVWIVHHCYNLPWASASPGCEVACCLPHLLIAAFQKGLMTLLVASLAFVFASIQKNEAWERKNKEKKEKPFWKYLPFPKILHNADTICFMQELVLSRQSLVLPPCVLLELWLSHSAGWHWLALRGVLVAEPLVWKGGKRQQCMQSLVLPLSKAPSWVGLWEDLSITPKE